MRDMKIEIEIEDTRHLVTLSRWASVQRTINHVLQVLETPEDELEDGDWFQAVEELREIGPALDRLHQAARSTMWAKMCGSLTRKMNGFTNDHVCRLEKAHSGACKGQ